MRDSGMAGQFLSKHVAVKQVEGKTFQRSLSVTVLDVYARQEHLLTTESSAGESFMDSAALHAFPICWLMLMLE